VADDAARIGNARKHILTLEPRIGTKQVIDRVAGRQHAEHVLDGKALASDYWLSAEDLRIDRDPLEKVGLVHERDSRMPAYGGLVMVDRYAKYATEHLAVAAARRGAWLVAKRLEDW